MKRISIALASILFAAGSVSAQYSMDLRKVKYPTVNYLNLGHPGPAGKEIRINNLYMDVGGVPQVPVMGEIHYSRMDHRYWRDALLKMKASGINIVATYAIWNLHEEFEGELNWSGNLNLRRFIELCDELGLLVHLRIGPYCNAEIRNGGLPDWLLANQHLKARSNDPLYLAYAQRWYTALYNQVKGLLYKDGGPIMAIQLENEYVQKGQIIPHLTTLKKMAVQTGFDLPLYTMTHWMDSEYPKGEIVPYAGFYIEAPWTTSGKQEMPTSNFEFFTYNRLSDNIGTDIIKLEGDVESLSGENNDSPFFTCEIGVGTTAFYHRRAVVPEEMAGEMINLRLGCGANLMGYYMYAGGTNPVGKATTMQSSGPRVSYDYQAPVREYATLGNVMPEVKKYNYFMNDFGTSLAPAVAYLPTSNQERNNLQWSVRFDGKGGYVFCSNYLYKHERQDFKNVQFSIRTKDELIRMPRRKSTVKGSTYFLWPFNQQLDGVLLKYSTTQPICSLKEEDGTTFFFFEDDGIAGEYFLSRDGIREIGVHQGRYKTEKSGYFVDQLTAGKDCVIEITKTNGSKVRLITLTEEESDDFWKVEQNGKYQVALTKSALVSDAGRLILISEEPEAKVDLYSKGTFQSQTFRTKAHDNHATFRELVPMQNSCRIAPVSGESIHRRYALHTLSSIERAYLRYEANDKVECFINGKPIDTRRIGEYFLGDATQAISLPVNELEFKCKDKDGIKAEVEILLKNGSRIVWNTDATWLSSESETPVVVKPDTRSLSGYAPEEHFAVYEVNMPQRETSAEETRLYITYAGNVANAYQNGQLVADSYYDGTDWILSADRLPDATGTTPLLIRIEGLESVDAPIYFEKNVDLTRCLQPKIWKIQMKQEYRFEVAP